MWHELVDFLIDFAVWFFYVPAWIWQQIDMFMASYDLCTGEPWKTDLI